VVEPLGFFLDGADKFVLFADTEAVAIGLQ